MNEQIRQTNQATYIQSRVDILRKQLGEVQQTIRIHFCLPASCLLLPCQISSNKTKGHLHAAFIIINCELSIFLYPKDLRNPVPIRARVVSYTLIVYNFSYINTSRFVPCVQISPEPETGSCSRHCTASVGQSPNIVRPAKTQLNEHQGIEPFFCKC